MSPTELEALQLIGAIIGVVGFIFILGKVWGKIKVTFDEIAKSQEKLAACQEACLDKCQRQIAERHTELSGQISNVSHQITQQDIHQRYLRKLVEDSTTAIKHSSEVIEDTARLIKSLEEVITQLLQTMRKAQ